MKSLTKALPVVVLAASAMIGATTSATANNVTATCTHGVLQNADGHRSVSYESSRNSSGQHIHKHKHDVNNKLDHHPERNC